MRLAAMTETDFNNWAARSKANYAKDKMRANSLTEAEANEMAETDFLRLLPDGLSSNDNFLFTMKSDDESVVGYLWFAAKGAQNNRKAFIFDIVVEAQHRGKGYGRRAMLLAEEEARKLGLVEIGLHVFGFNRPAINLYESLGYKTTDLVMAKKI